MLPSNKGA